MVELVNRFKSFCGNIVQVLDKCRKSENINKIRDIMLNFVNLPIDDRETLYLKEQVDFLDKSANSCLKDIKDEVTAVNGVKDQIYRPIEMDLKMEREIETLEKPIRSQQMQFNHDYSKNIRNSPSPEKIIEQNVIEVDVEEQLRLSGSGVLEYLEKNVKSNERKKRSSKNLKRSPRHSPKRSHVQVKESIDSIDQYGDFSKRNLEFKLDELRNDQLVGRLAPSNSKANKMNEVEINIYDKKKDIISTRSSKVNSSKKIKSKFKKNEKHEDCSIQSKFDDELNNTDQGIPLKLHKRRTTFKKKKNQTKEDDPEEDKIVKKSRSKSKSKKKKLKSNEDENLIKSDVISKKPKKNKSKSIQKNKSKKEIQTKVDELNENNKSNEFDMIRQQLQVRKSQAKRKDKIQELIQKEKKKKSNIEKNEVVIKKKKLLNKSSHSINTQSK